MEKHSKGVLKNHGISCTFELLVDICAVISWPSGASSAECVEVAYQGFWGPCSRRDAKGEPSVLRVAGAFDELADAR